MMKTLWNQCKWQKDLLILELILTGGMLVLGIVITLCCMDESDGVVLMGTMLAMMGFVLCALFAGLQMTINYNYALSFGQTRKRTLPAFFGALVCINVAIGLVVKLFAVLEKTFFRAMYPDLWIENIMSGVLQWRYLLPLLIAIAAFSVFLGACVNRFGKAAYMVIYFGFILVFVAFSRCIHLLEHSAYVTKLLALMEFVSAHTQLVVLMSAVVVTLVCLTISHLMLHNYEVHV